MIATLKSITARIIREEEGATLVEYVLLVALIGVLAIVGMKFLGNTANNKLGGVANNVANGS